jgi:GTP pyrophosphokinase
MGLQSGEELLVQVGTQRLRPNKVVQNLLTVEEMERGPIHADKTGLEEDDGPKSLVNRITESFRRKVRKQRTGIRVDGLSDILVRTAKCCQPVPGDRIMGFVTQTQGVSIHQYQCANIVASDPSRKVHAYWESETGGLYPTWIRVVCENTQGKLADMSNVFSSRQINILNANCHASVGAFATNDFEIVVQNSSHLEGAMSAMRKLPGVVSVERLQPN